MKRMLKAWLLALAVLVGVQAESRSVDLAGGAPSCGGARPHLSRRGTFGRIHVQGGRKHIPDDAEVCIERKHPDDVKDKIRHGWSKRKGSGKSAASPKDIPARGSDTPVASPNVLASYDISIRHGGKKWQPAAGDPVRVTVELEEPVPVTDASSLGVVHLADDGTVENLPASRYGFTYNAAKTAVTAFWFKATGFSVYAITETEGGDLLVPRRYYHFYGRSTVVTNGAAVSNEAYPYEYHDRSNDVVNVQIVKDGDLLVEPPVPPNHVSSDHVSVFKGWYVIGSATRAADAEETKLDDATSPFSFTWPQGITDNRLVFTNVISVTESADADYWVVPLYENARFLLFYENFDEQTGTTGTSVVGRKLVALNDDSEGAEHVLVSDVSAPLRNSMDEYFSGWRYKGVDNEMHDLLSYTSLGARTNAYLDVDNALFEANGGGDTIPLYPIYVSAHFLNFDTAAKGSGAGYVPSIFVRRNSEITQLETCSRDGYSFAGWYTGTMREGTLIYGEQVTDADGNLLKGLHITDTNNVEYITTDATTGRLTNLGKDTTIYARWTTTAKTTYRVVIWQQKITDKKDAPVESNTYDYVEYYVSGQVDPNTAITSSHVTSFTGTDSHGITVTRQNLTTRSYPGFHYSTYASKDVEIAPEGTTVINVYYDRNVITFTFMNNGGTSTLYTMTGLYGQTLASCDYTWPTDYWWYSSRNSSGTRTTFLAEFLPAVKTTTSETFYGSSPSSSGSQIYFYKQSLEDANEWILANTAVLSGSGSFNISDKYTGFTAYQYSNNGTSWNNVGTYNESTGYYGNSVSTSSGLRIRFSRNQYTLTYFDGDNLVATSDPIYYEASLTNCNLSVTNVNWGARDTEHYTFDGWYEDASLTVPFDFNGTMSAADKAIYAKWSPVKYRVIIDPNGGQLQSGDSTWFYLDYNEKILEYFPSRDYKLDMLEGTFGYSIAPYDPVKDKYSPLYDPTANRADRHAYYTDDVNDITDGQDPRYDGDKRYTYAPGAYVLMGWFEVDENDNEADEPFNFSKPVNKPITLRAVWRRAGVYKLRYESVDPDGVLAENVVNDPAPGLAFEGYADSGDTTVLEAPSNYDTSKWIFEGWQVVDKLNGSIPLSDIVSPGDPYIVSALHADRNNIIHFRAVYTLKGDGSSKHVPQVVDLVLDSNANAGLDSGNPVATVANRIGTYTDGTVGSLSGLNQGVWFTGQMDNFSVALTNYATAFANNYGYFLLGWDTRRNCTDLIPQFAANAVIGTDKANQSGNVLYAVWEPQVMIEFTNATGVALHDITLEVPAWASGELFRVNTVTGAYGREAFTNFVNGVGTFDLGVDEVLRLVLPDSADMAFSVSGVSDLEPGNKLTVTRKAADASADDVAEAYGEETYLVSGTMKVSERPVKIIFAKDTYPTTTSVSVRYFIHKSNGTTDEITPPNSSWQTAPATTLTVTAAPIDLAAALSQNSLPVHDLLTSTVMERYGHTTIGIGAADGAFNEFQALTQGDASGGSYIRFARACVEWSRHGTGWKGYDDAAVYVVFYEPIPVQVTVAKSVVGLEADKTQEFDFSLQLVEHSTSFVYRVTKQWQQRGTRNVSWISGYTYTWNYDPELQSASTNFVSSSIDQDKWSDRTLDGFSLTADGQKNVTFYYHNEVEEDQYETGGSVTSSSGRYYTNWTETVTYTVTYRYETLTVTESPHDSFVLTGIAHDQSGVPNVGERKYTVSSLQPSNAVLRLSRTQSVALHACQNPDVVTFTNTHNTGVVTVNKTVVNAQEGDEDDMFQFRVELGEKISEGFDVGGATLSADGKNLSFSLAAGGTQTLNLPLGISYTVTEGANSKYNATSANASGTVNTSGSAVTFTNTRKPELAITVNPKTVYYNATEQTGYEITNVTGTGGDVSADDYTVIGLQNGDVLTVVGYLASRGTEAGEYDGDFANAIVTVTRGSDDVTTEYHLGTQTPGTLTINKTPILVTVTATSKEVSYNGEEQEYDGEYEYTIKNTLTQETVSDSSITVAVGPDYRLARGTNAGTYPMHFDSAGAVTVNASASYEVSIAVVNGNLVITRVPATVTADDKSKWPGTADPELTATVTGLFGEDTVSYSLARASGDTQGTYVITATGDAEQGNYTVSYVNGTFTIKGLSLVQRKNDEELAVQVAVSEALLTKLFNTTDIAPNEANATLNAFDPNGLRRWENLVTGTPFSQLLLNTATGNSATIAATMVAGPDNTVKTDLGYTILRELRKKGDGEAWDTVAGPLEAGNPSFNIELADGEGKSTGASGLYRVVTLIVPNHMTSITNEIPSTNIIGVLEVKSPFANTIVAVPWKGLASNPSLAESITASNFVSTVNLSDGDSVLALKNGTTYEMWALNKGKWESATTVSTASDANYSVVTEAEAADKKTFSRGNAVWVTRKNPTDASGNTNSFFLVGQYDPNGVTIEIAGGAAKAPACTQIAIPDYTGSVRINDIDWGGNPISTDLITIPNGETTIILRWVNGSWGQYKQVYNEALGRNRNTFVTYTDPIPVGTGFWYSRRAGAFSITWQPSEVVK